MPSVNRGHMGRCHNKEKISCLMKGYALIIKAMNKKLSSKNGRAIIILDPIETNLDSSMLYLRWVW